jgi:diguanylate cyclase (GGDEF)-like protein
MLFILIPCSAQNENRLSPASNGIIDFSSTDTFDSDPFNLDGYWEFFWNRLFTPEEIRDSSLLKESEYLYIPGSWTLNTSHPAKGYGTLHLKITGLSDQLVYSLYIPDLYTSYRLWINGKELSRNGRVGKSHQDSSPQNLPRVISFDSEEGQVELVIQISNYHYRKSGVLRSFFFGTDDQIRQFRVKKIIFEISLISFLFTVSLFHLGVFISRRSEKMEFIFGLICLSLLFRILTTGEQLLTFFLPDFPWEILRRMEFTPFYLIAPLALLYFTSLFPEESLKIVNRLYIAVCLGLGVVMIFLPVRISNHLLIFAECWLIAGIFYVTYIMIKALIHKRQSSIVMMTAFIIFSIAIINDILYAQNLIQSIYLSPLGFFLFLIMQSQMLVRRFTLSFTQRELLAQSRDKFRHASITDSLTGLYNVRYLCEILDKEMLETLENKRPLSIIMADVDNFKNYNDTWGHKQGDELLKRIAEILSTSARDKDSPCRYGGEEFAIVFPNTLLNDAWEVSERIRLKFESVGESDPRMTGITVSVGVAQYIPGETADSFIERADKALYKAKNNGKNRVEMAF